ncbi:MGMT family protein, partial [Amylibacter sp.]|nr:MGMT family protein [Amylibacter sp.]
AIKSNIFKYWPHANFHHDESFVSDHAASILENKYPLDIHMIGSPFQTSIWKALLKIPVGKVTTYSDIAYQIGNPSAVRAVATAIGKNPICLLIPCHRVISKSGGMGGYRWGLNIKNNLLVSEL